MKKDVDHRRLSEYPGVALPVADAIDCFSEIIETWSLNEFSFEQSASTKNARGNSV